MTRVDIILPCYNPGSRWPIELENFYTEVNSLYDFNFIIINDGSTLDKLNSQIEYLQEKKIPIKFHEYVKNRGKGYALRYGVSKSSADYLVYTDIDFPFTNQSILKLIQELISNSLDVAAGYRGENYYQKKMSRFRKSLSKSFRFFITKFLNMSITDTQCGLKGFNQKGKERFLKTTIDRYLFDFEFIYTVSQEPNLKIKAVEVKLKDNIRFSKMPLKILLQEIINLIRILSFKRK